MYSINGYLTVSKILGAIKHVTEWQFFCFRKTALCIQHSPTAARSRIRHNLTENVIFVFPVLPGSAEIQVICGVIVKRHLTAYFISNISAKIYQYPSMCVKVIASQMWDFWVLSTTSSRLTKLLLRLFFKLRCNLMEVLRVNINKHSWPISVTFWPLSLLLSNSIPEANQLLLLCISARYIQKADFGITVRRSWAYLTKISQQSKILLRPNSITLSGSKLVRSWSQTCSELKFGLSSSLLAAN